MNWRVGIAACVLASGIAQAVQDPTPVPREIDAPAGDVDAGAHAQPHVAPETAQVPQEPEPAPERKGDPDSSATPPAVPPAVADPTAARNPTRSESFRAALEALAREHPEQVEIRSIGQSRGALNIPVAVVADTRAGDPARRPALLVCAEIAALPKVAVNAARGPEALVRLVQELLARAQTSAEVAAILRESTIYVVPAPDPDRWFGGDVEITAAASGASITSGTSGTSGPARRVDLNSNFPVGWEPAGTRGGAAGPYPLSEPESRALASFVQAHPNIAALLLWPVGEPPLAQPIEAGTESSQRQPSRMPVSGVDEPRPGSFALFCAELAGAPVFREGVFRPLAGNVGGGAGGAGGAPSPGSNGVPGTNGASGDSLAAPAQTEELTRMLRGLPQLSVGAPVLERLRENLWVVDVTITNRGRLPSLGAALRARWSGPSVWLESAGARIVSALAMVPGSAGFQPLRGRPGAWFLADLDGGAQATLRLIVEAEENATLELAFQSLRAGAARASVPLR